LSAREAHEGLPGHTLLPLEPPPDEPARLRLVRDERALETTGANPDPGP
jgi:hypothetical protein